MTLRTRPTTNRIIDDPMAAASSRRVFLVGGIVAGLGGLARIGSAAAVPRHRGESIEQARKSPEFRRGFCVSVVGNDPAFQERLATLLDRLLTLHVNSVSVAFNLFQDDWTSSSIQANTEGEFGSITEENLRIFIQEAHRRGLSVMVSPLLDEMSLVPDGQWRGSIRPRDIDSWFRSYSQLILGYAKVAQEEDVEFLSVGAELQSLEPEAERWVTLIQSVREIFAGQVTYGFNWDSLLSKNGLVDRSLLRPIIDATDFIGISAYYPLDVPGKASVPELVEAWSPWISELDGIRREFGKPLVFTEVGTRSIEGSYRQPNGPFFDQGITTPVSEQAQRDYVLALCQGPLDLLAGTYIWRANIYTLSIAGTPEELVSYSPLNKLAEGAIGECYGVIEGSSDGVPAPKPTPAATIQAGTVVVVTEDSVNLRSAASTSSEIVAVLQQGTELLATGPAEAGWVPVEDPITGTSGYVAEPYLEVRE